VAGTDSPLAVFDRVHRALGHRYDLDRLVALSPERVLFRARDRMLKRPVSLRVILTPDTAYQEWFLREAEAMAQLDHPAIRHLYDIGIVDAMAFRVGNWIEGEGFADAVRRGPRPIPTVIRLARDVLSALEHTHARGLLLRRLAPASLITTPGGGTTLIDMRYSSYVLAHGAPPVPATDLEYMAPEIRDGYLGDQAADIYGAGTLLFVALTGQAPPEKAAEIPPPSSLRPSSPEIFDRLLARALHHEPGERFLTASEMLESLASEAGTFDPPQLLVTQAPLPGSEHPAHWEKRLRRALGDDYELLKELGAGAFGRVYQVRDLHLERDVAMKVLNPVLTQDPAVVERFRREAQLAARLNHPHIVDIYDIGGRGGLIWYTMELVQGPSLARMVEERGPLPLDEVVRFLREGLSALAHAHAAGLVHRDIKPENLLIESGGSVRITDFGLAIALRGQGRFGGATSQSGTPQFASPEQLLGEHVDPRTDLYSLAAVAYFTLLGEPPFRGRTPEEILAHQTTDRIQALRNVRPDVPKAMEQVLRRALASDPDARYASASEFMSALAYAAREGANPEGTETWSHRWLRS